MFKIMAESNENTDMKPEEMYLYMKNVNKLLNAHLRVNELTTTTPRDSASETYSNEELLTTVIEEQMKCNILQQATLSTTFKQLLTETSDSEQSDPTLLEYQTKINEKFECLNNVTKAIKKLINGLEKGSKELNLLTDQVLHMKDEHDLKLKKQKQITEEQIENETSAQYKKDLEEATLRLKKMNFMRMITSLLLIYSPPEVDNFDMFHIIEDLRDELTMDTFKSI